MAREHADSKDALCKVGALRVLATLLSHESKQVQLNSCATLYAITCAGRAVCKQLAGYGVLPRLCQLVNPGLGRSAQDDQLQLFAALLVVNLLHVRGLTTKGDRIEIYNVLQRAYDDTVETQVRDTIALGLRRLKKLDTRKSIMKTELRRRAKSLAKDAGILRQTKPTIDPAGQGLSAMAAGGGLDGGGLQGLQSGGPGGGPGGGMPPPQSRSSWSAGSGASSGPYGGGERMEGFGGGMAGPTSASQKASSRGKMIGSALSSMSSMRKSIGSAASSSMRDLKRGQARRYNASDSAEWEDT